MITPSITGLGLDTINRYQFNQTPAQQEEILQSCYFEVRLAEASELMPDFEFGDKIKNFVYVPKSNTILSTAGNNYALITNKEVLHPLYQALCRNFGQSNIIVEVSQITEARCSVNFVINQPNEIGEGERLYFCINAINSYDQSLKFGYRKGYMREICTNGLWGFFEDIQPKSNGKEKRMAVKHTQVIKLGKAKGYCAEYHIQDTLATPDIYNPPHISVFETLAYRPAQMRDVFALIDNIKKTKRDNATQHIKRFPQKQFDTVAQRISNEAQATGKVDWFKIYNGFNYVLNHHQHNISPDNVERIDRALLDYILQYSTG